MRDGSSQMPPRCSDGRRARADAELCSKYVAKFSDSSYEEWFSDNATAIGTARKILFEYGPYEAEMALQLRNAQFKQWDISTESEGMRSFRPGRPTDEPSEEIIAYMDAAWRCDGMPLLEFLRKSGSKGPASKMAAKASCEAFARH